MKVTPWYSLQELRW